MERRFFMNDFEQSLKEHADNFQMAPSKKVWHGIYNDLHPGKRWPSVTMSLLLVFTLVVIGHLNTNNSRRQPAYLTANVSEPKKVTDHAKKATTSHNQRIVVRKTDLDKGKEVFVYATGQSNTSGLTIKNPVKKVDNSNENKDRVLADNLNPGSDAATSLSERNLLLHPQPDANSGEINNITGNINDGEASSQNNIYLDRIMNATLQEKVVANHLDNSAAGKKDPAVKKSSMDGAEVSADKNSDGTSAKTPTPAKEKTAAVHKKRNDRITWIYFAAPEVSSVSLSGQPLKLISGTSLAPTLPGSQKENKVIHNSALGMEAGAQMNYSFSKSLQFTIGGHLTYSGYNIISNEVHPTPATLVLRNPATGMTYVQSFMTHYGDGTGSALVSIRNYSWQISMPVGLQYRFMGNDKVQFNVAGSIEPSLILKSKAYILSSDGNNYINDPDIMRKWNMSSNFGAFVTFSSPKFKWQIGPNVRYQWLSTYLKDYTIKEHLIDYGIRIGVSK